jgi:myo-inositol-1(or 4)-monophosphatase
MHNTRGLRRMGSAAIDLAYTACGRFDGFFELNLSPWDVAAGVLLVREAGGVVTTFNGDSSVIFENQIVAASQSLYPKMTEVLQGSF